MFVGRVLIEEGRGEEKRGVGGEGRREGGRERKRGRGEREREKEREMDHKTETIIAASHSIPVATYTVLCKASFYIVELA